MTHFGDTDLGKEAGIHGVEKKMSEYYLADQKSEERARQRELEQKQKQKEAPASSQDVKVTLLGDFLFPTSEPQGCDPYNSSQGRTAIDAWRSRRDRR